MWLESLLNAIPDDDDVVAVVVVSIHTRTEPSDPISLSIFLSLTTPTAGHQHRIAGACS